MAIEITSNVSFRNGFDTPLLDLANDPGRVAKKHDQLTKENGPYMANGSMRTLRAIYNHARKTNRSLPHENPADAVATTSRLHELGLLTYYHYNRLYVELSTKDWRSSEPFGMKAETSQFGRRSSRICGSTDKGFSS